MERHPELLQELRAHLAAWGGANRRELVGVVVMGVLLCMPYSAHSSPSLRVNGLEISPSKHAQRRNAPNVSHAPVNPAHRFNVSSMASSTSFARIISEDSYAFSHKEDLGFSMFLDRRSESFYTYRLRPTGL
jgi:hypothetical protein